MTFGEILKELDSLKLYEKRPRATRRGWNGKGMWIRCINLYADAEFRICEEGDSEGTWLPFLVMKTVDNKLVPWLASQTDTLADDWEMLPA
jgi:hypothetical protein